MKREIIAIDEQGRLSMPIGCDRVRMTEMELAELFGVLVPTIRAAISALYKSGFVRELETTQCIRLPSGNYADTYNLETILALAFRLNSHHAAIIRQWLLQKAIVRTRVVLPIVALTTLNRGY